MFNGEPWMLGGETWNHQTDKMLVGKPNRLKGDVGYRWLANDEPCTQTEILTGKPHAPKE